MSLFVSLFAHPTASSSCYIPPMNSKSPSTTVSASNSVQATLDDINARMTACAGGVFVSPYVSPTAAVSINVRRSFTAKNREPFFQSKAYFQRIEEYRVGQGKEGMGLYRLSSQGQLEYGRLLRLYTGKEPTLTSFIPGSLDEPIVTLTPELANHIFPIDLVWRYGSLALFREFLALGGRMRYREYGHHINSPTFHDKLCTLYANPATKDPAIGAEIINHSDDRARESLELFLKESPEALKEMIEAGYEENIRQSMLRAMNKDDYGRAELFVAYGYEPKSGESPLEVAASYEDIRALFELLEESKPVKKEWLNGAISILQDHIDSSWRSILREWSPLPFSSQQELIDMQNLLRERLRSCS